MSRLTPEQILDTALEVKRGTKALKNLPAATQAAVKAAMKKPINTQMHARKQERAVSPTGSRFQKPRPERARFV